MDVYCVVANGMEYRDELTDIYYHMDIAQQSANVLNERVNHKTTRRYSVKKKTIKEFR